MKEPEPYRDADIWFSETEEEEERAIEGHRTGPGAPFCPGPRLVLDLRHCILTDWW